MRKKATRVTVSVARPQGPSAENPAPPSPPATNPVVIIPAPVIEEPPAPSQSLDVRSIDEQHAQAHDQEHPVPDDAPEENHSTLELVKSLPLDLQFYLNGEVDLKKLPSTKQTLVRTIRHFFPSFKPPSGHKKGFLVDEFKARVTPLLSAYREFLESEESDANTDDDAEMYDEGELLKRQSVDFSGLNPNQSNITIEVIVEVIKYRCPSIDLPPIAKLNKPAAIRLWHKHVCLPPKGGIYPAPFTTFHKPVPVPFCQYLTRDELRYGIQCHSPRVYINITADHKLLLALYIHFVLESISDDDIFEGIDYHCRQEPENDENGHQP